MKPTKIIDQSLLSSKPWILEDAKTLSLKDKIESVAIPLKDWQDVNIYYGIKTGLNEAFIIDTQKKDEILKNCNADERKQTKDATSKDGENVNIYRGILTGLNEAFIIDTVAKDDILKRCIDESERERTSKIIKPILRGRDVKRYRSAFHGLWLINSHNGKAGVGRIEVENGKYPTLFNYLKQFEKKATNRLDKGVHYTNLRNCAYLSEFEKEKIVWAETSMGLTFTLISKDYYLDKTCFMLLSNNNHYLLSILNSRLSFFYIDMIAAHLGYKGLTLSKVTIEKFPIPCLNPNIPSEKETYDRLCELSLEMMELHKVDTKDEKIADRIYEIDGEINRIVYKLYKLTCDEIEIIEDRL